jgi:hypothetical protein
MINYTKLKIDKFKTRKLLFWICFFTGIFLAIIIRLIVTIPPLDKSTELPLSPGPVDVYVRFVYSYQGIYQRFEKIMKNTPLMQTLEHVEGEKRELRNLDISGTFDPHYNNKIRETQRTIVALLHDMSNRLEKGISVPGFEEVVREDCENILDIFKKALKDTASELSIGIREFRIVLHQWAQRHKVSGEGKSEKTKNQEKLRLDLYIKTFQNIIGE